MLPPLAAGLGTLDAQKLIWIAAVSVGLHVFALNVLFPKVIGHRLNLNPLVVTIALLVWGWIRGAMGLILALPITGAMKIISIMWTPSSCVAPGWPSDLRAHDNLHWDRQCQSLIFSLAVRLPQARNLRNELDLSGVSRSLVSTRWVPQRMGPKRL
jgi:hypothetical protein